MINPFVNFQLHAYKSNETIKLFFSDFELDDFKTYLLIIFPAKRLNSVKINFEFMNFVFYLIKLIKEEIFIYFEGE